MLLYERDHGHWVTPDRMTDAELSKQFKAKHDDSQWVMALLREMEKRVGKKGSRRKAKGTLEISDLEGELYGADS